MNIWFLIAGGLSLLSAAAHGLGGEITILSKVRAEAFPTMPNGDGAQAKAETRMTWHAVTLYFAATGVLLILMALGLISNAGPFATLTVLHSGMWALLLALLPALTLRDPKAILRSPQWVLLLVLAAITYGGIS
jgi:hypothetical protein